MAIRRRPNDVLLLRIQKAGEDLFRLGVPGLSDLAELVDQKAAPVLRVLRLKQDRDVLSRQRRLSHAPPPHIVYHQFTILASVLDFPHVLIGPREATVSQDSPAYVEALLDALHSEQQKLIVQCELRLSEAKARAETYKTLAKAFEGRDVLPHFWNDRLRETALEISRLASELSTLQYGLALIMRGVNLVKPPA